jgi:hypothetical protein
MPYKKQVYIFNNMVKNLPNIYLFLLVEILNYSPLIN